jgi:tetratricopeptide (TPR) repeat protein
MQRNIFISGLTLLSVLFVTATSIRAELASDVNLKIQNIERDADIETEETQEEPTPKRQNPRRKSRQLAANSERSMEYVQLGVQAYEAGDKEKAILYYYEAVKIDETNGYAFMGAAVVAGATKDGIICMKTAAALFKIQKNQKAYDVATRWLERYDAAE